MYLFTTPQHRAHPAFVVITASDNPNESVVSGSYAGSRDEFNELFEGLLAYVRDRRSPAVGTTTEGLGAQQR